MNPPSVTSFFLDSGAMVYIVFKGKHSKTRMTWNLSSFTVIHPILGPGEFLNLRKIEKDIISIYGK